MSRAFRTITVGELLDALEDVDRDLPVIFSADYGDRGKTQQALPLRGDVEEVEICESGYSNSGFAVCKDDEDGDEDGEYVQYLLIR